MMCKVNVYSVDDTKEWSNRLMAYRDDYVNSLEGKMLMRRLWHTRWVNVLHLICERMNW